MIDSSWLEKRKRRIRRRGRIRAGFGGLRADEAGGGGAEGEPFLTEDHRGEASDKVQIRWFPMTGFFATTF